MNYKSRESAVEILKRFFHGSEGDSVSIIDIFKATERKPEKTMGNMSWLSNHLYTLRHYGLVIPVYSYGQRKRLEKVRLTNEGTKALGRLGGDEGRVTPTYSELSQGSQVSVSLAQMTRLVATFKKENPEFEVTFGVKLKSED